MDIDMSYTKDNRLDKSGFGSTRNHQHHHHHHHQTNNNSNNNNNKSRNKKLSSFFIKDILGAHHQRPKSPHHHSSAASPEHELVAPVVQIHRRENIPSTSPEIISYQPSPLSSPESAYNYKITVVNNKDNNNNNNNNNNEDKISRPSSKEPVNLEISSLRSNGEINKDDDSSFTMIGHHHHHHHLNQHHQQHNNHHHHKNNSHSPHNHQHQHHHNQHHHNQHHHHHHNPHNPTRNSRTTSKMDESDVIIKSSANSEMLSHVVTPTHNLIHQSTTGLRPLPLPIFPFQGRMTSHPSHCLGFPSISPSFLPRVPSCFPSSLDPYLDAGRADNYSFPIPLPVYIRSRSPSGTDTFVKPKKCRRSRTVFTELQLMGLEKRFEGQKYLSTPDRMDLAESLGLSQIQVKTWYQNRRMKWKKQVLQRGAKESPTKPKGRPKKDPVEDTSDIEVNEVEDTDEVDEDDDDDGVDDDVDDNVIMDDRNSIDDNDDHDDNDDEDLRCSDDYRDDDDDDDDTMTQYTSSKVVSTNEKILGLGVGRYDGVVCPPPSESVIWSSR